jgi:transcriptional regulator with XRE-family HTH domain
MPAECGSSDSSSPLVERYASAEFQVAWDNEISFHVAENTLHLRRLRGLSQAAVARAMATSQPKVARIEGGDENITLRTLKRLAQALRGRIQFSLVPAEMFLPRLPRWWEIADSPLTSDTEWKYEGFVSRDRGPATDAALCWRTQHQISVDLPTLPPAQLTAGEVS